MKPVEGRRRVVIEEVQPQVDCGRYPAKRILGDIVTVSAAVFGDGHDHVAGAVGKPAADWRLFRSSPSQMISGPRRSP
jgi:starch synthase (maltosyl-transferring)